MRECRDILKHLDFFRGCVRCEYDICTICNGGTQCHGECALPPRVSRYPVRLFPELETSTFDSLSLPHRCIPLYALIEDMEIGEGRDQEHFVKLVFFTMKASWFDELSLSKVNPDFWSTAALEAEPAYVHIGASKWLIDSITKKIGGAVYFDRGAWVQLWIEGFEDEEERESVGDKLLGIPATVYFYANKHVSSIGLKGPSPLLYYIVRIQRIRPTKDGLLKLMRFKRRIARA